MNSPYPRSFRVSALCGYPGAHCDRNRIFTAPSPSALRVEVAKDAPSGAFVIEAIAHTHTGPEALAIGRNPVNKTRCFHFTRPFLRPEHAERVWTLQPMWVAYILYFKYALASMAHVTSMSAPVGVGFDIVEATNPGDVMAHFAAIADEADRFFDKHRDVLGQKGNT